MEEVVLRLNGIRKVFPGVVALDGVDFDLLCGEVHALVGENGAGKSTLIKLISGVHRPDAGTLQFRGRTLNLLTPRDAQQLGIAVIYQEMALFPDLTVLENLFTGSYLRRGWWIDWHGMERSARAMIDSLDVQLDLNSVVGSLSTAQQQIVEIARALLRDARVLIMDEPTGPLTQKDARTLFRIIRQLKARGVSVIYISHRLEEVFEVADRVTVLRDGRHVLTAPTHQVTKEELIRHMVGRSLDVMFPKTDVAYGGMALEVKGLRKGDFLKEISFSVRYGEIVGFAGLIGSGRTTLAHAIFGIDPPDHGRILVDGREVRIIHPGMARELGIAYIPEDRQHHGIVLPIPVRANLSMVILDQLTRFGFINGTLEDRLALRYISQLDIRTPSFASPTANLSGGNQQKIVVGKWLASEPRILIMDEPTRGIDVGAKAEIHRLMSALASRGLAILLISSELPELLGMCDRILVMHRGQITGELTRAEATPERVMAMATGITNG